MKVRDDMQSLSQQFGDNLLFKTRYRYLKLAINETADFLFDVGILNHECELFQSKGLTEDQFKP